MDSWHRSGCRGVGAVGTVTVVETMLKLTPGLESQTQNSETPKHTKTPSTLNREDIIAILGMDELSEEDKLTVARARKAPSETRV